MPDETPHVIIRKIAASPHPDAPAAMPDDLDQEANDPTQSLPIDYEIEGHLLAPIAIGGTIRLRRFRRNDVFADGIFESSEIVAIREPFVETQNSIYRVDRQPTGQVSAAA